MPKKKTNDQAKIDELTADLQRVQADFVNYKRRTSEEQAQIVSMAKEQVILQLLPVLDNVYRALAHLPSELEDNAWANGVKKVGEQILAALKEFDVTPIEAMGKEFDPNQHEAINFEDGEGETDVVVEELQTGYKMGDRVIRPSMVKVGKQ